MHKFNFKIQGMHCASCELWVESAIKKIPEVEKVEAKLNSNEIEIIKSSDISEDKLFQKIENAISSRSSEYKLLKTNEEHLNDQNKVSWKNYLIAFLIALVISLLFLILQNADFLKLSNSDVNYPYIFLIGIVASLSTCAATVGALVLSISANFTKAKKSSKFAISTFHIGRLISFFILGGLLGILGNFISFNLQTEIVLRFIIQFILIILGLNLLGFNFAEKLQFRLPKIFSKNTFELTEKSELIIPFLLGILTFFLPCGFTQSMQLLALETKSFLDGSLTMFIFALGTLPILLGISKLSENFGKSKYKDLFFKVAGFITIFMAIYGIYLLKSLI